MCGNGFDFQGMVYIYSRKQVSHALFQRAYCEKCLSDGIEPLKAAVVYRHSSQGNTSMIHHTSKVHQGASIDKEEPPLIRK